MSQALDHLAGPGKPLKAEAPDANEIGGLLRTGVARLNDARNGALALESRFDLAYNAAHALCLAASQTFGFSAGQSVHRLSGAATHAEPWPRGVARAGQVPQRTQPGRIRRLAGCG